MKTPRAALALHWVAAALVIATVLPAALPALAQTKGALPTVVVAPSGAAGRSSYDGQVEAVRQTALSAQVPGAIVDLPVKAGDHVKTGQVLVRLDARAAQQTAAAGAAQAQAARATLQAATREFARQKQLFEQHYISQAALDQAEAQYKAAQAEAQAQLASAGAASTQSGFYVLKAPYAGVVADVPVVLGDMAMPGRVLLTVYDPAALRVTVAVPEAVAARLRSGTSAPTIELAGHPAPVVPRQVELLPTVDPATHTVELRLALPGGVAASPGMFARAWVPSADASTGALLVPARAVVRRAELTAVYVIGADGQPVLRQVRAGRTIGDQVEVMAGVSSGDHVVLDPQAAAQAR